MPLRPDRFRALKSDFREYLTRRGAWPPHKHYRDYMIQHHGGASGNMLTDLRQGKTVAEKASIGLIGALRCAESSANPASQEALATYLETEGGPCLADDIRNESLLDLLCESPAENPAHNPESTDFLQRGVRGLWDVVADRLIVRHSRPCATEELREHILQLCTSVGNAMASKKERLALTEPRALEIAEEHMGIDLETYQAKVAEWHHWKAMTVHLALGRKRPTGLTIILPLTPAAYEAVRSGHCASFECTVDDLQLPSQHLLMEAACPMVAHLQSEPANPTRALLASLLVQMAHMAALHENTPEHLCLLSFAGTPENRKRLQKQQFRSTGAKMPKSGVEVMERRVAIRAGRSIDFITIATLRHIPLISNDG